MRAEIEGMDAAGLAELVASCQEKIAVLQAVQAGAVGAMMSRPEFAGHPVQDLCAELAARLTITPTRASELVGVSDRLTRCLPRTLECLAQGRTDWARATVMAEETNLLTDAQTEEVDAALAGHVSSDTTGRLRARVRKAIARLDPEAVRRRARQAVADRSVRYFPLPDGIAELVLRGPATELRCAFENLTSLGKDTSRPGAGVDPHAATVHGEGAGTDGDAGADDQPAGDRPAADRPPPDSQRPTGHRPTSGGSMPSGSMRPSPCSRRRALTRQASGTGAGRRSTSRSAPRSTSTTSRSSSAGTGASLPRTAVRSWSATASGGSSPTP